VIRIVGDESDSDESDGFSEVDVTETNTGTCDTVLDSTDYSDKTLILAPGEDERPSSLYQDIHADYLACPTIYAGQKLPENLKKMLVIVNAVSGSAVINLAGSESLYRIFSK
jgi:hypothetical protein